MKLAAEPPPTLAQCALAEPSLRSEIRLGLLRDQPLFGREVDTCILREAFARGERAVNVYGPLGVGKCDLVQEVAVQLFPRFGLNLLWLGCDCAHHTAALIRVIQNFRRDHPNQELLVICAVSAEGNPPSSDWIGDVLRSDPAVCLCLVSELPVAHELVWKYRVTPPWLADPSESRFPILQACPRIRQSLLLAGYEEPTPEMIVATHRELVAQASAILPLVRGVTEPALRRLMWYPDPVSEEFVRHALGPFDTDQIWQEMLANLWLLPLSSSPHWYRVPDQVRWALIATSNAADEDLAARTLIEWSRRGIATLSPLANAAIDLLHRLASRTLCPMAREYTCSLAALWSNRGIRDLPLQILQAWESRAELDFADRARTLAARCWLMFESGQREEAIGRIDMAVRYLPVTDSLYEVPLAIRHRYFHATSQWSESYRYGQELVRLAEELGQPVLAGRAKTRMGHACVEMMRLEEAEKFYREAIQDTTLAEGPPCPEHAAAWVGLGNLLFHQHRTEEARDASLQSLAKSYDAWNRVLIAVGWINVAACELELGRPEVAIAILRQEIGRRYRDLAMSSDIAMLLAAFFSRYEKMEDAAQAIGLAGKLQAREGKNHWGMEDAAFTLVKARVYAELGPTEYEVQCRLGENTELSKLLTRLPTL